VEDGLAAGAAIAHVVDDAAKIDAKAPGHGVRLAGKTRCLAISEPDAGIAGQQRLANILADQDGINLLPVSLLP
jgi:hypothetical protein